MPSFIYINGFPGTGKLTIAHELQKLISGSKILHNHLLIDPVTAIVDRDSPEYHTIRASIRQHILTIIATSESTEGVTWIFTDSRSSDPVGSSGARDYQLAAERRGGVDFIPIVLDCSLEENLNRVVGRAREATGKIVDTHLLRQIRQQETIHRFGRQEGEFELDVTNLSAPEAADRILQHVNSFTSRRVSGLKDV